MSHYFLKCTDTFQESTPPYPRPAGLALGSCSILIGYFMLLHFLIFTCKKIKTKVIAMKSLDEKSHEKGENEFQREPNRESIKTIIKIEGQDKNAKSGPG